MTSASIQTDFAVAGDAAEIAAIMTEAAAWMLEKDSPAWDESALTETFLAALVARSEVVVARANGKIVGSCTLSRHDPEFWPEAPPGVAAYIHKLAVRRAYSGRVVTPYIIARCGLIARTWGCSWLRLDCHPNLRAVYEGLGFAHVDTVRLREDFVVDRFELPLQAQPAAADERSLASHGPERPGQSKRGQRPSS